MIEKISLDWLKSFVFFVETGGVEAASNKLRVSQPAITQHLNKLQSQLPKNLFSKVGKRKVLTAFGKEFYQSVSVQLRMIDDTMLISKNSFSPEPEVTIRLGINSEIYRRICHKLEFDGQLIVEPMSSVEASAKISKGEIDIAASRYYPDSTQVIAAKWYTDNYMIVYPNSYDKEVTANRDIFTVLLEKKFILHSQSEEQSQIALGSVGIDWDRLRIQYIVKDWHSFGNLVENQKGWGVIPNSFRLNKKTSTIDIETKQLPKSQYYVLYRKATRDFPGFQRLLQSLLRSMEAD